MTKWHTDYASEDVYELDVGAPAGLESKSAGMAAKMIAGKAM